MYNSATEQKIKDIPTIGDIDIDRLPQDLTRIYAQIVSLRRQVVDGTINFQDEDLVSGLTLLRKLANNLETILLTFPQHEQKESVAFVAGTANNLIHKMGLINEQNEALLEVDSISSYIAATVLFLIGNSQADAAETAISITEIHSENLVQQRLISCIISLATGKLSKIADSNFNEDEVIQEDFQQTALNYLWRELGLGIINIAKRLVGQFNDEQQNHFDRVIELSISAPDIFDQRNIFSGPYRLAKLLKILEEDIFNRAVIDIPPPTGVDPHSWYDFLSKLAKDRPYLWENHKDAVETDFLTPGISAVLTLPTGAGKSTLSELKIASCLYSGRRVIYLVPTHALEDQVNRNLRKLFDEFEPINIKFGGEYTDFEEIESFPILVMTPERCLTFLNINPEFFDSVGLVIFDEFHLIHGTDIKKDRRSIDAMYCLLSVFTLASHADYLLISAMVENGDEIASWVKQITKKECKVFNSTWKPTRQLHGCLVFDEDKILNLNRKIQQQRKNAVTKAPPAKLRRELIIDALCFFSLKNVWETDNNDDYFRSQVLSHSVFLGINNWWQLTSNRNNVAAMLAIHFSNLGLKTLVFVDDPRITNSTSRTIAEALNDRENSYDEYIHRNQDLIESIRIELGDFKHSFFTDCKNVGVHHGLLLPLERTLIENYFKSTNGAIALVATATLAQGINLPAEIVIIAGDDRFDEDGENRQRVNPHELLNAAGRAGRAGLSSQGAVILIPGDIVTIKDSTISDRWWDLKNEVFSKGDQCLKIEDPLEYFLDTMQENNEDLTVDQKNILYRFKPENISHIDTKNLLNKSFYAYKAANNGKSEQFNMQVRRLLDRINELYNLSEEYLWQKEIGIKTGVEPLIIYELGNAIEQRGIENLLSKSITELIDWFFEWISTNEVFIEKIFTKKSTIDQIKKSIGLKSESSVSDVLSKIGILADILKYYVQGIPLNELNDKIPDVSRADNTGYLVKARNFVNRLAPELSFGFGLLSMVLTEKANQEEGKQNIPWDIRVLASCIREGFDYSLKLFYKKNNKLLMRVETHLLYNNEFK
ncbi:Helicase conserved C-terminal domain-containing protein [Chryseobacterium taichungense]|uniref:Helicase conserved C-terminal domain-containing protein n=1 Tax=Chryseobacterium taichungense TaxID=295069 RepID=A0A1H7X117_9FLAO|nr:DEAD/DEAH box helicase [Chryseobacterium taichungense]SEM27576.1 Helicase conserved C-terminal domain-containing protein [Chryseobacterium taichungense]